MTRNERNRRRREAERRGEEDTTNPEEEEPIRPDGEEFTDIAETVGTTDLPCGIGSTDGDCERLDDDADAGHETGPAVESPEGDASGTASDILTGWP